jgi:RloB-like protein
MARTIKIDNVLQKKFAKTNKLKSDKDGKDLRVYFLIVCEGEKTEPNYFKAFPKRVGAFVYDFTFDGGGISTTKVVEKAVELRDKSPQKYDRVWTVFDRDSFVAKNFNEAIEKASMKDIGCAWSNEAFELWYLLHFHNRVTAMPREEYKKAIEAAINSKTESSPKSKKQKPFKYLKNLPDMYEILLKYGNQDQAVKWARELEQQYNDSKFATHNPSTMVFKLVEELTGKSETLNTQIIEKFRQGE